MFLFILSLILIGLALAALLAARQFARVNRKNQTKLDERNQKAGAYYSRYEVGIDDDLPVGLARNVGIGLGVLGAIALTWSVLTVVPTKQIGIPVTFGRTGDPMSSGLHFKAPWTDVQLMDGTMQIDDNTGDKRTEIRLANQSVAYVQNNVRWSIRSEQASSLYQAHRSFDRIGPALEEQELATALNAAFKDYDPLAHGNDAKTLDQIAAEVKSRLESRIGDRLVIDSVTIPKVDFDERTQGRIDAYQTEIGNTRIAEQRKKTAAADADANRVLASSVSNDPNVLVSRCLDQFAEMVNKGQQVPVGFSCWPGTDKPSVIVGGTQNGGK